MLFPGIKAKKDPELTTYIDHIAPLVILVIDYVMNRIPFNLRHLIVSLFVMLCYSVVNLSWTLSTGTPVYAPLNFKDVMSYVFSLILFGMEGLGYVGLYYLTRWKLGVIERADIDKKASFIVFNVSSLDKTP